MSNQPLSPNTIRCRTAFDSCIKTKNYIIDVPKNLGPTFDIEVHQYGNENLIYNNRLVTGYPSIVYYDSNLYETNQEFLDDFTTSGETPIVTYRDLRPLNTKGRKYLHCPYVVQLNCVTDCAPKTVQANTFAYIGPELIPFYISGINAEGFIYEYRNKNAWIRDSENTLFLYRVWYMEDLKDIRSENITTDYTDIIYRDRSYNEVGWNEPKDIGFQWKDLSYAETLDGYLEMPSELTATPYNKPKKIQAFILNWGNHGIDESLGILDVSCMAGLDNTNKGTLKISQVIQDKLDEILSDDDVALTVHMICPQQNVAQADSFVYEKVYDDDPCYRPPYASEAHEDDTDPKSAPCLHYFTREDNTINFDSIVYDEDITLDYLHIVKNIYAENALEFAKGPVAVDLFSQLENCKGKYIAPTYELKSYTGTRSSVSRVDYDRYYQSTVYAIDNLGAKGCNYRNEDTVIEKDRLFQEYQSVATSVSEDRKFIRKVFNPEDLADYIVEESSDADICLIMTDEYTPTTTGYLRDWNINLYNFPSDVFTETNKKYFRESDRPFWMSQFVSKLDETDLSLEIYFYKQSVGDYDETKYIPASFELPSDEKYKTGQESSWKLYLPFEPTIDFKTWDEWPNVYYNRIDDLENELHYPIKVMVSSYEVQGWVWESIPPGNLSLTQTYRLTDAEEVYQEFIGNRFIIERVVSSPYIDSINYTTNCGFLCLYTTQTACPESPRYIGTQLSNGCCPGCDNRLGFIYGSHCGSYFEQFALENGGPLVDGIHYLIFDPFDTGNKFDFPVVDAYTNMYLNPLNSCGSKFEFNQPIGKASWDCSGDYNEEWWVDPNNIQNYSYYPRIGWVPNSCLNKTFLSAVACGTTNLTFSAIETAPIQYRTGWYTTLLRDIASIIDRPILPYIEIEPVIYKEEEGVDEEDWQQIYNETCSNRQFSGTYILSSRKDFEFRTVKNSDIEYLSVLEEENDDIDYVDGFSGEYYLINENKGEFFREMYISLDQDLVINGDVYIPRVTLIDWYGSTFEYRMYDIPDYSTKEYINGLISNGEYSANQLLFIVDDFENNPQEAIFTITPSSLITYNTRDICNLPLQIKVRIP